LKIISWVGMFCLILLLFAHTASPVYAQAEGLVYHVPLRGEINSSVYHSLKHAFSLAARDGAELIILEIDTFGGYVHACDEIKNLIYDTQIPVYAYVKKAISGGAYVALACDRIYMLRGSTLGAAEPVAGGAPVTNEKDLSVIEGQMRTMAERQGRDPEVAAAMVRKDISIPDVIEKGKLLTLTAAKALEVGYTEGIVDGIGEIPRLAGISQPKLVEYSEPWGVRLARFLSNPLVGGLLLAIGLAALVIEVITAGFSGAGLVALLAFALFFGGNLLIGVAQWEHVAVFILGIILLIAEAFTAGFGLLGVAGLICIAASIVLSAATFLQGLLTLGLAIVLAVVIVAVAFRFLRKSVLWNRLILSHSETKEMGYVAPRVDGDLLGLEGTASTPLRPSGKVSLSNGQKVDAVSEGSYIEAGTEVVVTGFSSGSVVVTPKKV
jgi:membrane-bound serine protease (ClpP class)